MIPVQELNDGTGQQRTKRFTAAQLTAQLPGLAPAGAGAVSALTGTLAGGLFWPLADNTSLGLFGLLLAKNTATGASALFQVGFLSKRGIGSGSVVLVGDALIVPVSADSACAGWGVSITANASTGGVALAVTGASGITGTLALSAGQVVA